MLLALAARQDHEYLRVPFTFVPGFVCDERRCQLQATALLFVGVGAATHCPSDKLDFAPFRGIVLSDAKPGSTMSNLLRRTKIVATIGPASNSPEVMRQLIFAGMDVARVNFSHGDKQGHARTISTLREISRELDTPITILQDLQGMATRRR